MDEALETDVVRPQKVTQLINNVLTVDKVELKYRLGLGEGNKNRDMVEITFGQQWFKVKKIICMFELWQYEYIELGHGCICIYLFVCIRLYIVYI